MRISDCRSEKRPTIPAAWRRWRRPSLPALAEPGVELRGRGWSQDLHTFSLGFEVGVGLVGEGQVKVLHGIFSMPCWCGRQRGTSALTAPASRGSVSSSYGSAYDHGSDDGKLFSRGVQRYRLACWNMLSATTMRLERRLRLG
jgi:hypothetical protein